MAAAAPPPAAADCSAALSLWIRSDAWEPCAASESTRYERSMRRSCADRGESTVLRCRGDTGAECGRCCCCCFFFLLALGVCAGGEARRAGVATEEMVRAVPLTTMSAGGLSSDAIASFFLTGFVVSAGVDRREDVPSDCP